MNKIKVKCDSCNENPIKALGMYDFQKGFPFDTCEKIFLCIECYLSFICQYYKISNREINEQVSYFS